MSLCCGNTKTRRLRILMAEEQRLLTMQKQSKEMLADLVKLRNILQIEKLELQSGLLAVKRETAQEKSAKISKEEKDRLAMPPPPAPEPLKVNFDDVDCNQKEIDLCVTTNLNSILSTVSFDESESDEEEIDHDFFVYGEKEQSADVK